MLNQPEITHIDELVEKYDAFGFDSYGVLVDGIDPLPGALEFTRRLNDAGKPWIVATNDASRLPATRLATMNSQGFAMGIEHLVTSGSLLKGFFESRGIIGTESIATGSGEAVEYVELAGCVRVILGASDMTASSLVLAGISGYDWEGALSDIVSLIFKRMDMGYPLHLAVPNPDVLYPDGFERYSIGPGGLAGLIESAVMQGFGDVDVLKFARLGKPYAPMFDEIKRRLPDGAEVVFIGDQLRTDIAGANLAGIDSVLMGTGISRWRAVEDFRDIDPSIKPKYLLESLL